MERGSSLEKTDKEFEVREYVLPKFEVVLKPPGFIKFNDDSDSSVQKISIDICAT